MLRSLPSSFVRHLANDEPGDREILDSNLREFFISVRTGNLIRVKYLVEECDVPINIRDQWDSSPLYYACLCGHMPVVRYLLKHGARCEPNTFDGERCLYGALTDQIRNLLRVYKLQTQIKREPFREFMRKLQQSVNLSDFTFIISNREIKVHRCVLCARSSFLCHMFNTMWRNKKEILIQSKLILPDAFVELVTYWYTGMLDLPGNLESAFVVVCEEFAEHELAARVRDESAHGAVAIETDIAKLQDDLHFLYRSAVPIKLLVERNDDDCDRELDVLPFAAIDSTETNAENSESNDASLAFPDLCFELRNTSDKIAEAEASATDRIDQPSANDECNQSDVVYRFYAHKCFFFERSEYFRALLANNELRRRTVKIGPTSTGNSSFSNKELNDAQLQVDCVPIRMQADVFREVVRFVYTQRAVLSREIVWLVLETAEMLLLTGLKRACGIFLETNELDVDSCVDLVGFSRLFNLSRLEQSVVRFMAFHLDELVCPCVNGLHLDTGSWESARAKEACTDVVRHARCVALSDLVRSDASAVRGRQETDTVVIVDEIRYHINTSEVSITERNRRLALITAVLDHLRISA